MMMVVSSGDDDDGAIRMMVQTVMARMMNGDDMMAGCDVDCGVMMRWVVMIIVTSYYDGEK